MSHVLLLHCLERSHMATSNCKADDIAWSLGKKESVDFGEQLSVSATNSFTFWLRKLSTQTPMKSPGTLKQQDPASFPDLISFHGPSSIPESHKGFGFALPSAQSTPLTRAGSFSSSPPHHLLIGPSLTIVFYVVPPLWYCPVEK